MKFPINIQEFLDLDFKKQIHMCAVMWLSANGIVPFPNGKINGKYFVVKAYLMKVPTQTIRNIAMMLIEAPKPCQINEMIPLAAAYVRKKQSKNAKVVVEKIASKKEYDIDLMGFLQEKQGG